MSAEDPLAEILDLVGRLDAGVIEEHLDAGSADQLLTGLTLVARAITGATAATTLGETLGVELDVPESREDARRRRAGVRIDVQDDDTDVVGSEDVSSR